MSRCIKRGDHELYNTHVDEPLEGTGVDGWTPQGGPQEKTVVPASTATVAAISPYQH